MQSGDRLAKCLTNINKQTNKQTPIRPNALSGQKIV